MPTPPNERETLEALIESPGWGLLQARLQAEWGRSGSRFGDLIEKMANSTDRATVADEIQRVIWVQKELQQFFRSFEDRLHLLRAGRDQPELSQSRRGVL